MIPHLITREFPAFDERLEESIEHFTDLSIACDCVVGEMSGAHEALTLVLYKHRVGLTTIPSLPFDLREDVDVVEVLRKVWAATSEILAHERQVRAAREFPENRFMRAAREQALARIDEAFLATNAARIKGLIKSCVLPIVKEVAAAGLPAVSLVAPAYFMARAVLWRASPAFADAHEESLQEQSKPYRDCERARDLACSRDRPNIFLDIDPLDPENPDLMIGYRPSSPRLALILATLESWPVPSIELQRMPRQMAAPAPTAAQRPSVLQNFRRTLKAIRIPSFRGSSAAPASGGDLLSRVEA